MNLFSTIGILDTNGMCSINIPNTFINNSFYIAIKHRNSIETWSANPVLINNGAIHNFTNSANKAYGDNLKNDGGVYLIFGGDINQDSSVDSGYYGDLDLQSTNGDIGYLVTDLNGDSSVDSGDYQTIDNNSTLGIYTNHP
jgi:hypothetical protein